MIQDITPSVFNNAYRPEPPEKNSYLLCYSGRSICGKIGEEGMTFPTFRDAEKCNEWVELYQNYTYLFSVDGDRFYLGSQLNWQEIPGFEKIDKEAFRRGVPRSMAFAGVTGWQLHRWYANRKFCGKCGQPMKHDHRERMLRCPSCGAMEFPKICPAVIVAVTDGNRILMTKYKGREFAKYALIAGFAEVGETIEDTVRREVMEEAGLKVKNITFYKSQPWSFSDTLLFGFFCEVDGDTEITLDEEELSVGEWHERGEMPFEEEDSSLTNEMMCRFRDARDPFSLQ